MKRGLIVLLAALLLACGGCSKGDTVSRAEYDALKAELDALKGGDQGVSEVAPAAVPPAPADEEGVVSGQASQASPMEILESGYFYNEGQISYVVKMRNPNADYVIENPYAEVTAKAADGTIMATGKAAVDAAYPGETVISSGTMRVSEVPAEFIVTPNALQDLFVKTVPVSKHPDYQPLIVSNVSLVPPTYNGGRWRVTGEITNPNAYDYSLPRVDVLFRNAESIAEAGAFTYANAIPAGGSVAFEVIAPIRYTPIGEIEVSVSGY